MILILLRKMRIFFFQIRPRDQFKRGECLKLKQTG